MLWTLGTVQWKTVQSRLSCACVLDQSVHTAAVLKGLMSALVRFEFICTLWRYVHPDAPVPLPPDHELDVLRRFTEHEVASSSLILVLHKARLSCYVLLTLLQRAAVLTVGYGTAAMPPCVTLRRNCLSIRHSSTVFAAPTTQFTPLPHGCPGAGSFVEALVLDICRIKLFMLCARSIRTRDLKLISCRI